MTESIAAVCNACLGELRELREEVSQISQRMTRIEDCVRTLKDISTSKEIQPSAPSVTNGVARPTPSAPADADIPAPDSSRISSKEPVACKPVIEQDSTPIASGGQIGHVPVIEQVSNAQIEKANVIEEVRSSSKEPNDLKSVPEVIAPSVDPVAGRGAVVVPPKPIAEQRIDAASQDQETEDDKPQQIDPMTALRAQMSFIDCFYDDLVNARVVLLSQLNNLYMMRSGQNLDYKACGYERLRNFITDIPGLTLVGRGNHMQAQISDLTALQQFYKRRETFATIVEDKGEVAGSPQFQKPPSIPDQVLDEVLRMFQYHTNGIYVKEFIQLWREMNFGECLRYKEYGFRDLRGFLSQVPFIEKVGCKSEVKYVLRAEYMRQFGIAPPPEPRLGMDRDIGPLVDMANNSRAPDYLSLASMHHHSSWGYGSPEHSLTGHFPNARSSIFSTGGADFAPPPPSEGGSSVHVSFDPAFNGDELRQPTTNYHFSSPGAFSSDTRDASKQQGKFDKCVVLHMHLLDDKACMIIDISNGTMLLTNELCEQLFESGSGENRLCQEDIFSLIHNVGSQSLVECFKYFLVSERESLTPQTAVINTLSGTSRRVQIEGCQLFGLWWRLEFELI
eukprot:TRINITY_DN2022_c1_g1_i1.p1 TRINITY_DN2022_c1_g1~~TRINITY_DN2022_c1_g1_i1.p1  ORF type:complete len:620 (+),score=98.24 TRINITY_DN2022_c1_g1_i1:65-1924(+)